MASTFFRNFGQISDAFRQGQAIGEALKQARSQNAILAANAAVAPTLAQQQVRQGEANLKTTEAWGNVAQQQAAQAVEMGRLGISGEQQRQDITAKMFGPQLAMLMNEVRQSDMGLQLQEALFPGAKALAENTSAIQQDPEFLKAQGDKMRDEAIANAMSAKGQRALQDVFNAGGYWAKLGNNMLLELIGNGDYQKALLDNRYWQARGQSEAEAAKSVLAVSKALNVPVGPNGETRSELLARAKFGANMASAEAEEVGAKVRKASAVPMAEGTIASLNADTALKTAQTAGVYADIRDQQAKIDLLKSGKTPAQAGITIEKAHDDLLNWQKSIDSFLKDHPGAVDSWDQPVQDQYARLQTGAANADAIFRAAMGSPVPKTEETPVVLDAELRALLTPKEQKNLILYMQLTHAITVPKGARFRAAIADPRGSATRVNRNSVTQTDQQLYEIAVRRKQLGLPLTAAQKAALAKAKRPDYQTSYSRGMIGLPPI